MWGYVSVSDVGGGSWVPRFDFLLASSPPPPSPESSAVSHQVQANKTMSTYKQPVLGL